MESIFYRTGQFARKAAVSVRTLHYYDQVGLLKPKLRSESGYRLYSEDDLPRLQQILVLKYLGFSLEEIQQFLQTGPARFKKALAVQKAMMQERKAHLEAIIQTIVEAEARLVSHPEDWDSIVHVIEVIQMEENKDWVKKYFNEEQLQKMNEISSASYSEEDREKLTSWGQGWSKEDQRKADAQWAELYAEAKRLADASADPAGAEAQALAGRWMAQVGQFTHGDPGVTEGLKKFWKQMGELPAEQVPMPKVLDDRQQAFMDQAMAVYNARQGSVS